MEKELINKMKNTDNNLKQVFLSDTELGWQLILANHNCKARVLGVIGYEIVDIDKPPKAQVETLLLLDGSEKTMSNLKGLKMRQRFNPQRKYKNFILDLDDPDLFESLQKMSNEELLILIDNLKPEFFKL